MYYLIIDTCVWIELSRNFPEIKEKITLLIEQKKVQLLLPSIIVDEWESRKPGLLNDIEQTFNGKIKNIKELGESIPAEHQDSFRTIMEVLQGGKTNNSRFVNIDEVDRLFKHLSTEILAITDNVKIQAAEFALGKKAPFLKNKNSMADALIIFSAIEYIAKNHLSNCFFISSNSKDFSSESNTEEIHEDLREFFETHGIKYFINIGKAINEIEKGLVSEESIWKIEELEKLDALRGTIKLMEEENRLVMENIMAAGRIPGLYKAVSQANEAILRQIEEATKAAGGIPGLYKTATQANEAILRQAMDAVKEAGGIPGLYKAASQANEAILRQIEEATKAAGGISGLYKAASQANEAILRQIEDATKAAGGIPGLYKTATQANEAILRQAMEAAKVAAKFSDVNKAISRANESILHQATETNKAAMSIPKNASFSETQKIEDSSSRDEVDDNTNESKDS